MMSIIICTIPRSGSHYLLNLLNQRTDLKIDGKTDIFPGKNKQIITVALNPEYCIASILTMQCHYGEDLSKNINSAINHYISMGNTLLENAKIIIDYNDLVDRTELVLEYIVNEFNGLLYKNKYTNNIFDSPEEKYIVSSSYNPLYKEIKNIVKESDLSECYNIYRKLINQSISI
jgi:hypothetical protein